MVKQDNNMTGRGTSVPPMATGGNPRAPHGHPASAAAAGMPGVQAQQEERKGGAMTVIIVLAAIVAVILIAVSIWFFFFRGSDFYDSNSLIGQAPYKSEAEIQAELDRRVEEGMLNISIASVIDFEDGASEGTAFIENVPSNRYVMQVDITLDDTGEQVYQSGGLKPDSYIEKIALAKDLDEGSYPATATFHALDPDTLDEVGQAAAKVTLNVLG